MPNIPCPDQLRGCDCIGDSPFKNLSAEAPDVPTFLSIYYGTETPPLGTAFFRLNCSGVCFSEVSQEAADLCAARAAFECIVTPWGQDGGGLTNPPAPPPQSPLGRNRVPFFFSTEQSASTQCPDGLPFTFTVPAGQFVGFTQADADEKARSYALRQAQIHLLCLSSLPNTICVDVEFNATVVASGRFLAQPGQTDFWEVVDGSLPPGLLIDDGFIQGGVVNIGGIPTQAGTYQFSIAITLPNGDFTVKPYTLNVMGITNGNALPDGEPFNAYSAFLQALGVTNPIFTLESGTLPAGLALDSQSGQIFGTPIQQETQNFVVSVTEAGTGITCSAACSIEIVSGCVIDPDPLPDGQEGNFYAQALTPPVDIINPVWSMAGGTQLPPGFDESVLTGFGFLFANACEQAGTFNFSIRVDGDGGLFCIQQKQIVVTPRTPFVWNITWPAPTIVLFDTGTENHAFNPDNFTANTDSGVGGGSPGFQAVAQVNQVATGGGTMPNLAGPGVPFAKIVITVSGVIQPGSSSFWNIGIFEHELPFPDNQIFGADQTLGNGTFTFFFPVGPGGPGRSLIVQMNNDSNSDNPFGPGNASSISLSATLS